VGGEISAPVQTGLGAHPASCTMGTGSFPGVTRPGRGANHPPPSSAEVKERVELYMYTPLGLPDLFGVTFTFHVIINYHDMFRPVQVIFRLFYRVLCSIVIVVWCSSSWLL